jgi:hypothetical protein
VLPPWRLVLLILLTLATLFSPQILIALAILVHWVCSVVAILIGIAFIVWFVRSIPRGMKGGASRIDFVDGAIHIHPLADKEPTPETAGRRLDSGTIPLRGDERLDLKRVGSVWTKVRLIPSNPEHRGVPDTIRIGMRCPVDLEPLFRAGVERAIAGARKHAGAPPHSPRAGGEGTL